MGLFKWLQKRGSTGSIARWVAHQAEGARLHNPGVEESALCEALFQARFAHPAARLSAEEKRHLDATLRVSGMPRDLFSLACAIWDIEIGSQLFDTPDRGDSQRRQCREVMREELERLRPMGPPKMVQAPTPVSGPPDDDQYFRLDEDATKAEILSAWSHADELLAGSALRFEAIVGRQYVYVITGSILLAQLGQPGLWQWVIDEAARRHENEEFLAFVQSPETREEFRKAWYQTTHLVLNDKFQEVGHMMQTALLIALRLVDEGPSGLPEEHRPGFVELNACLLADTAAQEFRVRELKRAGL